MIREVLDLNRLRALAPDTAAALLIARRLDGASSDDAVLEAWLALDDSHRRAWARANRADRAFAPPTDNDVLTAIRAAALKARPEPAWRSPRWAAAAAAVVLVLGGLTLFLAQSGPGRDPIAGPIYAQGPGPAAVQAMRYATLKGERKDVVLPDGSTMTLDTESAIDVAFAPARRSLTLAKGRAYFDVKHDATRPFVVKAGGQEVIALGTRFDVRLDPGRLQVVLAQGRVSVGPTRHDLAPHILTSGETLVAAGDAVTVAPADLDAATNWRRGLLTFHNDTLATAAAEFNRYSTDRLIVRDPRVAGLRVTGAFRAGDAGRFGRTLTQIHPVMMVRTGPGELEIVPTS